MASSLSGLFKSESFGTRIPKWSVDPQPSSCLFTNLPAEIRRLIFSHTLAEEQVPLDRDGVNLYSFPEPDWCLRDLSNGESLPEDIDASDMRRRPHDVWEVEGGDWLRPGTTGRKTHHTALLETCRRVFIEARDLLMENAVMRFFEGNYNAPPNCRLSRNIDIFHMSRYTANRLTSFQLFIPVHTLELGYLSHRSLDMSPVQDLRITIRQCDWWHTDPSPPQITPYGIGCVNRFTPTEMKDQMELTKDYGRSDTLSPIPPLPFGKGPRSPRGAWGAALSRLPRLKRFTMDFEYSEERLTELQELAEWAHRVWRFRLGGHMKGYYLSTEGNPIKKVSWRGLPTHWRASNWRHRCASHMDPVALEHMSQYGVIHDWDNSDVPACCTRRRKLMSRNVGPIMYTFTITWTARKLESEHSDDSRVLGPGELSGRWIELPNDSVVPLSAMDDWFQDGWPRYELLHPDSYSNLLDCPYY